MLPLSLITPDVVDLLGPNLEELRVLVHDVDEDAVDVAPQVGVQVLLILQGTPHLKEL